MVVRTTIVGQDTVVAMTCGTIRNVSRGRCHMSAVLISGRTNRRTQSMLWSPDRVAALRVAVSASKLVGTAPDYRNRCTGQIVTGVGATGGRITQRAANVRGTINMVGERCSVAQQAIMTMTGRAVSNHRASRMELMGATRRSAR